MIAKGLICIVLCLGLGACTPRALRCDGALQPINTAPVPAAERAASPAEPQAIAP
jgi:hypothetical protein